MAKKVKSFKMEEVDCILTAIQEWVKEKKGRAAMTLIVDEEDNISALVYGNAINLTTALASAIDHDEDGDNDFEDVFQEAQKLVLMKKLLGK